MQIESNICNACDVLKKRRSTMAYDKNKNLTQGQEAGHKEQKKQEYGKQHQERQAHAGSKEAGQHKHERSERSEETERNRNGQFKKEEKKNF